MTVTKIISGGQTGADMAGLLAAEQLKLETGGWMPKNYKTEDGNKPEMAKYGIKCLDSEYYPDRTMRNVDDADGTIVFRLKYSPGSDHTIGYALTGEWSKSFCFDKNSIYKTKYKPICVITELTDQTPQIIKKFVDENDIKVLNVAGHRERSAPIDHFTDKVQGILYLALK